MPNVHGSQDSKQQVKVNDGAQGGAERQAEPDAVREASGEAGSGATAGGSYSNTPLPIRVDEGFAGGGEDTAHIAAYVRWHAFDSLAEEFTAASKECAETGDDQVVFLRGGMLEFIVRAHGGKAKGKRGRSGPNYRFMFERGGVVFRVMNKAVYPNGVNGTPNVMIQIGSLALQTWRTLQGVWQNVVLPTFKFLQAEVDCAKPSRVDVCVDVRGRGMDEVNRLYETGCLVTRARKGGRVAKHSELDEDNNDDVDEADVSFCEEAAIDSGEKEVSIRILKNGRRVETLSIGVGNLQCRIYDKEQETRHDEHKRGLLSHRVGEVEKGDAITRVEFQLRRDALKRLGIDSLDDWFEGRDRVTTYLCHHWLRFTVDVPDKHDPQRMGTHGLWQAVQAVFGRVYGVSHKVAEPVRNVAAKASMLWRQAWGCIVSAMAKVGMPVPDGEDEFFSLAWEGLLSACLPVDVRVMREVLERKLIEHAHRVGLIRGELEAVPF